MGEVNWASNIKSSSRIQRLEVLEVSCIVCLLKYNSLCVYSQSCGKGGDGEEIHTLDILYQSHQSFHLQIVLL